MVEFGDELIIESFKIPWLIWIQLLVMILLILLLFYGFSLLTPDVTSAAATTSLSDAASNSTSSNATAVKEDERDGGTIECLDREEAMNGDEESQSSMKNSINLGFFRVSTHPCEYIRLMKHAFFKCFGLGLDSGGSDSSTNNRHEKQD